MYKRQVPMYINSMEPFAPLLALLQITDPVDRAHALGKALKELPGIQAQLRQGRQDAVLEMRAAGMSHSEVAKELGLTRSRAQQVAEGKTTTPAKKPDAA